MAANPQRLIELSMVPPLAVEVASQIGSGGLQIGTTGSTAMAGNRTPTATIRGGVLQQPSAGIVDVEDVVAALIAAGVLAS